jgi:hypothetical protein
MAVVVFYEMECSVFGYSNVLFRALLLPWQPDRSPTYIIYFILPFTIYSDFCRVISNYVRFEVFTAVTMKNGVFWVVTPCGSCNN